ncbi:hypothetical protein CBL_08402 [Carabus blaptoides fortunei]
MSQEFNILSDELNSSESKPVERDGMDDNFNAFFNHCEKIIQNELEALPTVTGASQLGCGTWVADELRRAVQSGCRVLEVFEVWCYDISVYDTKNRTRGLFFEYINAFLKMKQEATGYPSASNCNSNVSFPYCFITLSELHTFGKLTGDADKEESMEIDVDDIILKTFKNLKDNYNKFKCFGKDKEYTKKCVLPELHHLQGFTNHLFWNGIVPAVGREKDLLWPLKLKLVAKNYQGEIFEGNACRKLLQESDKLLDPKIYEHVGPFKLQPYVAAFKTMNKIVHDCFSTQLADFTDLDENLKKLRKDLESTGTSQTLKMHIILDHLKEGISLLNNDGLGLWSEQSDSEMSDEEIENGMPMPPPQNNIRGNAFRAAFINRHFAY